ncbi:MAG: hypothetical protein R2794_04005 [Chitinophagales bacterium]
MDNEMTIISLDTLLSDVEGLYFEDLVDSGSELLVRVSDNLKNTYRITFSHFGPYLVVEEGLRTAYWNKKDFRDGPLKFCILHFCRNFEQDLISKGNSRHGHLAVIATWVILFENYSPTVQFIDNNYYVIKYGHITIH